MVALYDIPALDPRTRLLNVVVDTPKGSRNKYKFDEDSGLFRLSRILPAGMSFPWNFGSIPRTRAEDGDALDVLVLMDEPAFAGCLLNARLLGVLRAVQREKRSSVRNDRLIAVAQTSMNRPEPRSLRDVGKPMLDDIEHFFVAYNRAQGRKFLPEGRLGVAPATAILKRGMHVFKESTSRHSQ
jgi:inorganic pyrophosphatase